MNDKCGCGREARYHNFDTNLGSCNKYKRCLSYDELEEKVKNIERANNRMEKALTKIKNKSGFDYQYKTWALEGLSNG